MNITFKKQVMVNIVMEPSDFGKLMDYLNLERNKLNQLSIKNAEEEQSLVLLNETLDAFEVLPNWDTNNAS